MTTLKFTPTAATYKELVYELDEWLFYEAGRHFENDGGFPAWAVSSAAEDIVAGRGFKLDAAGDVFKKNNPEPDEDEYFARGDVYDKKRKVFVTGEQQLMQAEKEWNAAYDKFVNDVWKDVYQAAITQVAEWLGENGYKPADYGMTF